MIYDDKFRDLLDEGESTTQRASRVEPERGSGGDWICDLRPSGGHVITGFRKKQDALDYEISWLEENILLASR